MRPAAYVACLNSDHVMAPSLYQPLFLSVVSLLAAIMAAMYLSSPTDARSEKGMHSSILLCIPLCIVLTVWLGMRPVSGEFGDTVNYALTYENSEVIFSGIDFHQEWLFNLLMYLCQEGGMDVSEFFTIIEFIYVFTALWAVYRLMPKNALLGMIFVCGSLMYFSFGVNGLRNGMACHILLLAMSYFLDSKYLPAVVLAAAGFSIHRSIALPIAAMVVSRWAIRDVRVALYIWLGSIVLSLLAGNFFVGMLGGMDFDDRMNSYASGAYIDDGFSRTGFRWDFLIYSAMPVLMGYIVLIRRGMRENWYRVLFSTYCLANAFWVLVIRIAYSNRFAYLSWFMYPVIIAYPLIMMRVWPDQDRKTAQILIAYVSFTVVMNTLYW